MCGAALLLSFTILFLRMMPSQDLPSTSLYDHTDMVDASIARYVAGITNARLTSPQKPPTSTLTIFDGTTNEVLGTWTLDEREFWTADPDSGVIPAGTWNVHTRCYTHDVWSGRYSPGTPLTEKTSRDFCF